MTTTDVTRIGDGGVLQEKLQEATDYIWEDDHIDAESSKGETKHRQES